MQKISDNMIGITESPGPGNVCWTMPMTMMIRIVRHMEDKGGVPLQQRQPHIGQAVQRAVRPHGQVCMIVMNTPNSQRQKQSGAIQNPVRPIQPLPDKQQCLKTQVQKCLPVCFVP